jgi:RNA polymerase sigma factor (sigma-70 family)
MFQEKLKNLIILFNILRFPIATTYRSLALFVLILGLFKFFFLERGIALKEQGNRKKMSVHSSRYTSRQKDYNDILKVKGHVDESDKLMLKMANGDADAFNRLYIEFCPILRRLFANSNFRHMSLDDFTQEVFTRLWQQRENYRGTSCFLTYLLGIARYTLSEKIRQSYKMARIVNLEELKDFTLDSHNGLSQPEVELYLKELAAAVKESKAKLTAKQCEVLELSLTKENSLHKASKKLGCSPDALRCRLKRARKRSRELLAPILER